jgi:hypothetical protein
LLLFATIFFSGSASPARRASLTCSPNLWKQVAGVYSTTSDHLNPTFAEMPTIYKNIEVSRDDIGDHMKTYAEERNVMNQPRKCLVGSMFGEKIMVISALLKWYVEHDLKVTQIHQVTVNDVCVSLCW